MVDRKEPVRFTPDSIKQASHPTIVIAHVAFKILSVVWYLFCGWFTSNLSVNLVSISFLVIIDFYITKNISGRYLVGLRWWGTTDADGNLKWRYETRDTKTASVGGKIDNTVFWMFTFAYPVCWFFLAFVSLLRLHLTWLLVCVSACGLSFLNAYLYLQASRKTTQQVNILNYIPDKVKTKAVDTLKISLVNVMEVAANKAV